MVRCGHHQHTFCCYTPVVCGVCYASMHAYPGLCWSVSCRKRQHTTNLNFFNTFQGHNSPFPGPQAAVQTQVIIPLQKFIRDVRSACGSDGRLSGPQAPPWAWPPVGSPPRPRGRCTWHHASINGRIGATKSQDLGVRRLSKPL
jgi:hypothetical protein